MMELDPRFHTPGWTEKRLKELEEEKQAAKPKTNLAPFVFSTPKLEESLARIAECLTYFVNRQVELDKREQESHESALQDALQGRDWSN